MAIADLTPAKRAQIDQAMAETQAMLDMLVFMVRGLREKKGRDQGLADAVAFLMQDWSPGDRDSLLVAALSRLADAEED